MNILVKHKQGLIYIALITYKFLLDYIFITIIRVHFMYANYQFCFELNRYMIGFCAYIGCIFLLPKRNSISNCINLIIFLMSYVTFIILYSFGNYPFKFLLYTLIGFTVQCLILRIRIKKIKIKKLNYQNKNLRKFVLFFLIASFVYITYLYGLPNIKYLDFYKTSEIRKAFETVNKLSALLLPLLGRIMIPISLAVSIKEKKWLWTFALIIFQVWLFLITGFKTYFFLSFVVIFFSVLKIKDNISFTLGGMNLAIIGSCLAFIATREIMIPALIFDRVLFFPALIKYAYFDFFSKNPFLHFSQSTIGHILGMTSPYKTHFVYMIGDLYFGKPQMYANTGYVADAFANAGLFGIILVCTLFAFIFVYVDMISTKQSNSYFLALLVPIAISFNDGALMTIFFSGGLAIILLILTLIDFDNPPNKGDIIEAG